MLYVYVVEAPSVGTQVDLSKYLKDAHADCRIRNYSESCLDQAIDMESFKIGLRFGINFVGVMNK